jgi:predicted kinase
MNNGTLVFFCGKMGSGKSTRSKQVATERNAVLISEDEWLATLYPGEISTFDEYLHFSKRLKPLVQARIENILRTGTTVVMDFAANSERQRKWFKQIISNAESPYEFYYLKVSDEICLKQIAKRQTEQPERAIFDTEAVFNQVNKYFESPHESEGLKITYA